MIKAIFFDFEGVITSTPMLLHKDFFEEIQKKVSFEEFDKKYKLAKIGQINFEEFMKNFKEYENTLFNLIKINKNAKSVLEELYLKKIPLFLASNHIDGLAEKSIEKLGVKKYFKKMFFSHKLGLAKPDKRFFEEIIKQSNLELKKGEMIFIDDAKRNLVTAKELGFVTIYLPNGISDDRRNNIDFNADFTINDLTELIPIVKKLGELNE